MTRCQICNKPLEAAESINLGIGPECASKYANGIQAAGSSVARVEQLASGNDPQVNRWIACAKRAIGAGRTNEARGFIERAERIAKQIFEVAAASTATA
jgi:uncharacterized protein DUF6011